MTSQGADELRVRHYLHQHGAHPAGHHHTPPVPQPPTSPPEDPMLLFVICLAGLTPGLATVWLLRHRGWLLATLAGLAVTLALPGLLLLAMVAMPPLGYVVAACSAAIAVKAYDEGRVLVGTAWAVVVVASFACTGAL